MPKRPPLDRLRAFDRLDWIRFGILAVGLACWATGLLPHGEAVAGLTRIAPILLFLGTVMVMVAIVQRSQVFDTVAIWLARAGRGRHAALFGCCVLLAAATTVFLNLDTTIVLLTPVMMALARVTRAPALAVAMTTVWLANTASLLLPVSNLTNLLAADRIGLSPVEFAARMWAPQLAALAMTMLCLWVWFWRRRHRDLDRYEIPAAVPPVADRRLFSTAAVVCVGFVAAVLAGAPIELVSSAAAAVLLAHCLVLRRDLLAWGLLPWRLLVLVTGLFLVVPTVMGLGADLLVAALVGTGEGAGGAVRAGLAGALLSNLVNNLPAYTAVESVVPAGHQEALLGLLVGTNAGSIVMPWGSLATLLWFDLVTGRRPGVPAAERVAVPMRRFLAASAVLAVLATGTGLAALVWS